MSAPVISGLWPCPIGPCPTHVQRTVDGTIADGLAAHLKSVHRLPEDQIRLIVAGVKP